MGSDDLMGMLRGVSSGAIKNLTRMGIPGRLRTLARHSQAARGMPVTGLTLSAEKRLLTSIKEYKAKNNLAWRREQITTEVRAEAQKSVKNLLSFFGLCVASNPDGAIPKELMFNTDKTVLVFNQYKNMIDYVLLPKDTVNAQSITKSKEYTKHLPNRIDLLVTVTAGGQVGPPILIKRMKPEELDGDQIRVIKFRQLRYQVGGMTGQMWLVPATVKSEVYFQKYYMEVLPAFVRHVQDDFTLPVYD